MDHVECFISCFPRKASHCNFTLKGKKLEPRQSYIFLSLKQFFEDTVTFLYDILLYWWLKLFIPKRRYIRVYGTPEWKVLETIYIIIL